MTGLKSLLGSVTPLTAALVGAVAAGMVPLAATMFELTIGRPSSTAGIGFLMVGFLGAAGAAGGALAGALIRLVADAAGIPANVRRGHVLGAAAAVAILAIGLGYTLVARHEARNAPHVITSTGAVIRLSGGSENESRVPGVVLGAGTPVMFRGGEVTSEERDDLVQVFTGGNPLDTIDLRGMDYFRHVRAVTARLDGARDWLALLISLRATGRREVLVIYDPSGARVHLEVLERTVGNPGEMVSVADRSDGRQEFVISIGQRLRYGARY